MSKGAPALSALEKEKDIDFDLLQDLMDVDIDPLDIDLEKDPLAAKVFKVRLIPGFTFKVKVHRVDELCDVTVLSDLSLSAAPGMTTGAPTTAPMATTRTSEASVSQSPKLQWPLKSQDPKVCPSLYRKVGRGVPGALCVCVCVCVHPCVRVFTEPHPQYRQSLQEKRRFSPVRHFMV